MLARLHSTLSRALRPSTPLPTLSRTSSTRALSSTSPPQPVLAVAASVFRAVPTSRDALEVLLIKRAKAPLESWWSLPGGRVEPGETMRQAAARELVEESALHVPPSDLQPCFATDGIFDVHGSDHSVDGLEHVEQLGFHYGIVQFTATLPHDVAAQAVAGSDASALAWIDVTTALPSLAQVTPMVRRVVSAAIKSHS